MTVLQTYKIPASKIYIFVANEEQKKMYEEGLDKDSYAKLVVGVKGLAEVRNFIFEYFPVGKRLVQCDDDIRAFLEYDSRARRHEKPLKDLNAVIERGFAECKKAGARLWGVYPVPNGFFMKPTVSTDFKFCIGSFWGCINPGRELLLPFGGEKEDYQRTIQFWEADGAVVRLNFVAPKTAYYKEPGGMQEGDRVAKQRATVKRMLKKWPQYIKLNPRRKSGYPELKLIGQKEQPNSSSDTKTRKVKRHTN